MLENLAFSLNATMPVFLLMVLGLVFRSFGIIDEGFAKKTNSFVFQIPLPLLVFKDLATADFKSSWDGRFVAFCFLVTLLSIFLSFLVSLLWKDKSIRGEYVQASYRSSAAILGIAFIQNIYGTSGMAPMMIIGSVPLYNIMAVLVLSLMKGDGGHLDRATIRKTLKGIVTNPILIGIVAGLLWSVLELPLSGIPLKTVTNLSSTATPLGLMAMGATFDFRKTSGKKLPAFTATFFKLVGFVALFLPLAVALGFREASLVAILVMLGSATTVSSFVMARNMGHEGTLSSTVVMLTTLLAAFSLTFWIWLLRTLSLI